MENIREKMIALIVDKFKIDATEITAESRFAEDIGADSIDMVELIMEFEKEFNISIPDEDSENIKTFGEAEDYIIKAISNESSI